MVGGSWLILSEFGYWWWWWWLRFWAGLGWPWVMGRIVACGFAGFMFATSGWVDFGGVLYLGCFLRLWRCFAGGYGWWSQCF